MGGAWRSSPLPLPLPLVVRFRFLFLFRFLIREVVIQGTDARFQLFILLKKVTLLYARKDDVTDSVVTQKLVYELINME